MGKVTIEVELPVDLIDDLHETANLSHMSVPNAVRRSKKTKRCVMNVVPS